MDIFRKYAIERHRVPLHAFMEIVFQVPVLSGWPGVNQLADVWGSQIESPPLPQAVTVANRKKQEPFLTVGLLLTACSRCALLRLAFTLGFASSITLLLVWSLLALFRGALRLGLRLRRVAYSLALRLRLSFG